MFAWWITPTFQEIFLDFAVTLPFPTRLVLATSETIRESHGLVILIPALVLAAIIVFFGYVPRSGFRDWILQRLPVFGTVVRLSDGARFTRYLADLMEAEVLLTDALRISGRNMGQTALRREAYELATELDSGTTDLLNAAPLRRTLPHTVIHVLQLKAMPSDAARMLRELSWMYDQQTHNRMAWISSAVGPFGIVFLGTFVGFYVVALFLPLVSLIENLS
jgi:type IV pilus assembly protein PilC